MILIYDTKILIKRSRYSLTDIFNIVRLALKCIVEKMIDDEFVHLKGRISHLLGVF